MSRTRAVLRLVGAAALAVVGAVIGSAPGVAGRGEEAEVTPTLIGQGLIEIAEPGPHVLEAVALTLAPGAATGRGPLAAPALLVVREGALVVEGPGRPPNVPERLGGGAQVALAAGADVSLRNAGGAPASLVAIALSGAAPRAENGDT